MVIRSQILSDKIDVNDCDQEPIQQPGFIQSQGFLLALESETFKILQVSANTENFLNISLSEVLI